MEGSKGARECARLCSSCVHSCRQPAFDVVVMCPHYEASKEWSKGRGRPKRDRDAKVAKG